MRVCIISDTIVTQEPRVLRQIWTFRQRGWETSIVGHPGKQPIPTEWDFHDMTVPQSPNLEKRTPATGNGSIARKLRRFLMRAPKEILGRIASSLLCQTPALPSRYAAGAHRQKRPVSATADQTAAALDANSQKVADPAKLVTELLSLGAPRPISLEEAMAIFYRETKHVYFRDVIAATIPFADLIVAHDYHVLPLADVVAQRCGSPIVMDIHEYAAEQYNFSADTTQKRYFDYVTRPMIEALHHHYFPRLRGLSCVSAGIAQQLAVDYALPRVPTVVRSTPVYSTQPFRAANHPIKVMYHGLIDPMRHLELSVRSLALWRPEFRLILRGPGSEHYIAELKILAKQYGVEDRFSIEPPVPFNSIVSVANNADIGYLAFMNYSRQRQFAAPNKFFEYIMAGLALAVMDVSELAPIVRQHGVGNLIKDFTPEAIADCVNSFDVAQINGCKRASLILAHELCWEREQGQMIEAYGLADLEARSGSFHS